VYPDCADDACNKRRLAADEASKMKARVYTGLLYRHWTQWQGPRRTHLLTTDLAGIAPRDLTPGTPGHPAVLARRAGRLRPLAGRPGTLLRGQHRSEPAVSTNSDLYVLPAGGRAAVQDHHQRGGGQFPSYSPNGKFLAYARSFARAMRAIAGGWW